MHRALVIFPSNVETSAVDRFVDEDLLPAFSQVQGFIGVVVSIGPLMGPSAKAGRAGTIVNVDFESLDAALEAIQSEAFAKGFSESGAMASDIYLFEVRSA